MLPFMGLEAFRKMVLALGDKVRIFVAESNGQVQGCTVVPFSRHAAYYVYGGCIDKASPGAMHLLHWESIKLFSTLGVSLYDFVGVRVKPEPGSKQEGLLTFKERFGGCLKQGYMWKYQLSPLKYRLYCIAARFRSGGDIVDNERHKLEAQSQTSS
jgi:lipid II:glycine glycyltransferase (peptidoglycan interpeptide bridge formation enzyme)